jgi:hypothetical protein
MYGDIPIHTLYRDISKSLIRDPAGHFKIMMSQFGVGCPNISDVPILVMSPK